ncbi:hypothetical protein SDJN03_17141, partial [Cucurbita argyrosperma subsp. sororia]
MARTPNHGPSEDVGPVETRPAAPANRPKDPRFDPTTAAFFSATRGQHVISSKLRLLSTRPTIPNLASMRPWLGFVVSLRSAWQLDFSA